MVVVDVANVVGSRPDGWWRDRAGAASRLLDRLATLPGTVTEAPDGDRIRLHRVVAVVEGRAREVPAPDGVDVVRSTADGDTAVVTVCAEVTGAGERPLAVTADRGLRARLPAGTTAAGPRWLLALLPQA